MLIVRMVDLSWHEWDLDAPEPAEIPTDGEPEGYILDRDHDPEVALAAPAMFEVVLTEVTFGGDLPDDLDLIRYGQHQVLATHRAKDWIESRWGRWLRFVEA